ncbi:hypothetical protein CPB84DRAFT_1752587 [Gymnopilus junonius]|uniref:Uncharacterized protein n=1 Tax=Gymnopilus junonius TaxID=109634 RepID=A0A9P5TGS2_GYMJU|nr:hypothetical protein CPB84DRAFT_1752587 [Gymnopilus junonius]
MDIAIFVAPNEARKVEILKPLTPSLHPPSIRHPSTFVSLFFSSLRIVPPSDEDVSWYRHIKIGGWRYNKRGPLKREAVHLAHPTSLINKSELEVESACTATALIPTSTTTSLALKSEPEVMCQPPSYAAATLPLCFFTSHGIELGGRPPPSTFSTAVGLAPPPSPLLNQCRGHWDLHNIIAVVTTTQ